MLHQGQTGCFGRLTVRASCCKRNIFEKHSGKWEIGILGCFGMILNWGCMEGLFWRENADLFYAFPQFPHTLDALLCAHWTAGLTARPPGIGSTTRNTIFQVPNRTIRCILDRTGGCWENFVKVCLSSLGWLGQRWDVQLFSHGIYAASRLFCAHSAGLLKSYM